MPFVPELVSTTRYSNRTTDASAPSTSDNPSSDAAAIPASKPRFLPEPIETTRRSNRAAPLLKSSASVSISPSSNSSTPKATLLNNAESVSQASASTVLPEPVETARRSNRAQPVNPEANTDIKRKGWGRDSCDEDADKEEHKPVILNRAQQRPIPVPIPGPGKSKWFPADEASRWGQQYHNQPTVKNTQPANGTLQGANRSLLPLSSPSSQSMTAASGHDNHANVNDTETYFQSLQGSLNKPEEAISSQVRDNSNYRNHGDPRQFNHSTNETSAIAGILVSTAASSNPANANTPTTVRSGDEHQEEVAGTTSLSSSPASSLKSNASGPNYILDSSSSQQRSRDLATVVPVITNTEYLSPSSCEEAPSGLKRPISPNAILVRDFGYDSSRPTLKLPKADASACSLPGVVPKVQQIPAQRNGPHTNINSLVNPQSGLLDPSTYITTTTSTSPNFTKPTILDLLRNQVLVAQSQLIKDKQSLLSPAYTPNNKHLQPLNGSDEPKRKKPLLPFSFLPAAPRSVNPASLSPASPYQKVHLSPGISAIPLLCESPMPTTLFYESSKMYSHGDYFTAKKQASGMSIASNTDSVVSRDTTLTTPSTRPSSPGPSKYGYPCTSTSSLVAMVCQTPQPICSDPPNMCPESKEDVSTEFVVAVFNYLSLGHESIARKFDKELCEATGWGLERVTTDRLGALREYVEEYVDRKPRFGSGMGGW